MGQEAYAMFPMLAEASARAKLMNAQATLPGLEQQKFAQEQAAAGAFGSSFGLPGAQPGPYAPPPQPGQASVPAGSAPPMNPWTTAPSGGVPGIRVPQPSSGGMVNTAGGGPRDLPAVAGTPAGTEDQFNRNSAGGLVPPDVTPPADQATAPHKWTPAPGETFNTPDGSRPRTLDEVMSALRKANPKADPATLARAAGLYMPWLQEGDQVLLRQEMMKNTAAMTELRVTAANERAAGAEAGKNARLTQTLDVRQKLAAARDDQRYAQQAAQQQYWEQKIAIARDQLAQTGSKIASDEYFKALAAKHNADYNLISTMFANGDMTADEKAAAQAQVDQTRDEAAAAVKQFSKSAAAAPVSGRRVKTTGGAGVAVPGFSSSPTLDPGTPATGFH